MLCSAKLSLTMGCGCVQLGVVGSCLCSITVDVSNVIISLAMAAIAAPLAATLVISYYHYHV